MARSELLSIPSGEHDDPVQGQGWRRRVRKQRQNLLALSIFLLLIALSAWPILMNANDVIIGDDIDAYINPWADWWTLKALREDEATLWHSDYLFYPEGADLTFHSFSHLNTAVSLALGPVVGRLAAYNLAILLNYVLAGFAMFQLARYLTGSATAALLAGIVFAFNTHNLYQSSHPVLVSVWVFPWVTLFLMRAIRENRLSLALLAAGFLILGALTSIHLLLLMAVWLALFLTYTFFAAEWPRPPVRIILVFALLSLLVVLPLLYPQLREGLLNRNESFMVDPLASISADLASYVVPPWIGLFVRNLYLGIVPTLLALLALAQKRRALLWFLLFFAAVLLAIGPRPHIMGDSIDVTLPWSLLLGTVLRNMYRANILISFALAMLVAYGWLTVRAHLLKRRAVRLAFLLLTALLILVDYQALAFPYTPVAISSFYTDYLDDVPDDVALAVVPTGRQPDKPHLFEQTFHQHKITGGVVSRSESRTSALVRNNPLLRASASLSGQVPIPRRPTAALEELASLNIGYLVIDKTSPVDVDRWRRALPMPPVFEDEFVLVYETGATPLSGRASPSE